MAQRRLTSKAVTTSIRTHHPVKYCKKGIGPYSGDFILEVGRERLLSIAASSRCHERQLQLYIIRACQNSCAIEQNTETERSHIPRPSIQTTLHYWTAIQGMSRIQALVTDPTTAGAFQEKSKKKTEITLVSMKIISQQYLQKASG